MTTDDDTPWEPPLNGTELEHLTGALDRLRATFRYKADDLDATGLSARVGASSLTLGGLLQHLAFVEDFTFATKLAGDLPGPQWSHLRKWEGDDDPTFVTESAPAELYALWEGAVTRSRERLAAALAHGGLDQPAAIADDSGTHASLRRLLCDLVEEYGRHTGHADLLREAVDGRVGEDPPAGWRPVSGEGRGTLPDG